MNMILFLILFILLLLIGRKRGFKTFISFLLCMLLIVLYLYLMKLGASAIITAFIICIIASLVSLFLLNGINTKTLAAFIGVMIVQVITFTLICFITYRANIGAFAEESLGTVACFNQGINYNMRTVLIGMYLVSIVGTVIDTSISVSSSMNEVLENNPKIKEKELYKSGMNIGGDILSTTINTLFFALISVFIGFFMWHRGMSFEQVINYKSFVDDVTRLLIAFIGSILIIPVTSLISSKVLLNKKINKVINDVNERISEIFSE